MRVVFMGTPEFAVPTLEALIAHHEVIAVVTQPDKPKGRGKAMACPPVKETAMAHDIPVYQPVRVREESFVGTLRELQPDVIVVVAFGQILPESILNIPPYGCINVHASLLPKYRGAAPMQWAIINGEKESGVTTFLLNHEIDKGAILCQQRVAIDEEDDAGTLHDKLMNAGTDLVIETIERIASGAIAPVDQQTIEPQVIRDAPKIFKETCRIDWSASGDTVRNLVRGLSPYPAAWSELHKEGASPIGVKIFRVHAETCPADRLPASGTLVTDGRTFMKVACADGYLFLDELQLAGKKRMAVADLLRGFKEAASYAFR